MYKAVTKCVLNEAKTIIFEIEVPLIAQRAMADQFVVFGLDELGERVPVSVGEDAVASSATVILAMGAGEASAKSNDEYIKSKELV